MASYRPERVAELIHNELDQRLRLEVKDPRVTLLSALSTYTILGQSVLYFDINPMELVASRISQA